MNARLMLFAVAVGASGCAGLGAAVAHPREPDAWKEYWFKQHEQQLAPKPVEAERLGDGGGRVVLLMPGLAIGKEFMAPMKARLERDGFRPVVYEDPDLITQGVANAARRLAVRVEALALETGQEKIDIVAECTGGVAARAYVAIFGGDRRVDHLVTFVSPHHGSMPASIASAVTRWQGLRDLERGSPLMQVLDAHPVSRSVRFTSIYSCDDGYLWPASTARVDGATNVEVCQGHLGHFDGFFDAGVYRSIVSALAASEG